MAKHLVNDFQCCKYIFFNSLGKNLDKVRDALYNTATTSTKASPSFNSQARDVYDENEVSFYTIVSLQINWIDQLTLDSETVAVADTTTIDMSVVCVASRSSLKYRNTTKVIYYCVNL